MFDYKYPHMTKDFGWIVDLVSVSDDGSLILAKCAFMQPPRENGSQWVNHRWAILAIRQGSIKVIERDFEIDRWSLIIAEQKKQQAK